MNIDKLQWLFCGYCCVNLINIYQFYLNKCKPFFVILIQSVQFSHVHVNNILSTAARGAYCCLSFITDSSLCATHPEEIHIAGKILNYPLLLHSNMVTQCFALLPHSKRLWGSTQDMALLFRVCMPCYSEGTKIRLNSLSIQSEWSTFLSVSAPCSPSCEFFWSISSWSLPALPSSGGCASAVSPLSAASPPRGFDYTKFVFPMFCFSVRFTMWLNFDGERLCHQWKEPFFLNVNFTVCAPIFVYLSAAEDQPVMHWSLMLIFAFPSF